VSRTCAGTHGSSGKPLNAGADVAGPPAPRRLSRGLATCPGSRRCSGGRARPVRAGGRPQRQLPSRAPQRRPPLPSRSAATATRTPHTPLAGAHGPPGSSTPQEVQPPSMCWSSSTSGPVHGAVEPPSIASGPRHGYGRSVGPLRSATSRTSSRRLATDSSGTSVQARRNSSTPAAARAPLPPARLPRRGLRASRPDGPCPPAPAKPVGSPATRDRRGRCSSDCIRSPVEGPELPEVIDGSLPWKAARRTAWPRPRLRCGWSSGSRWSLGQPWGPADRLCQFAANGRFPRDPDARGGAASG
jgi:hypothetical protein